MNEHEKLRNERGKISVPPIKFEIYRKERWKIFQLSIFATTTKFLSS